MKKRLLGVWLLFLGIVFGGLLRPKGVLALCGNNPDCVAPYQCINNTACRAPGCLPNVICNPDQTCVNDICLGGSGGGGTNYSPQNACAKAGLQMVCGSPPSLACKNSSGGCFANPGAPTGNPCNCNQWTGKCGIECQVNCWCVAPCTSVAPSGLSLSSPSNGASLSPTSVPLQWNAVNWGTSCSTTNDQYMVYVDTFYPPTTLRATTQNGTTTTNFTGMAGTTKT